MLGTRPPLLTFVGFDGVERRLVTCAAARAAVSISRSQLRATVPSAA
jgi:hypothetical protein